MKTLTQEELNVLDLVKTSLTQAKQILERNKALLKYLNSLPKNQKQLDNYDEVKFRFDGIVGCPHCSHNIILGFECETCVWKITRKNPSMACVYATFGGLSYVDVSHGKYVKVEYGPRNEAIKSYFGIPETPEELPIYLQELKDCKTFVKGHIEWALRIVNNKENDKI